MDTAVWILIIVVVVIVLITMGYLIYKYFLAPSHDMKMDQKESQTLGGQTADRLSRAKRHVNKARQHNNQVEKHLSAADDHTSRIINNYYK